MPNAPNGADPLSPLFIGRLGLYWGGIIQVRVSRRPSQAAQTAECQLYFKKLKIRPPKNRPAHLAKLAPVELGAVLVREMRPSAGLEALGRMACFELSELTWGTTEITPTTIQRDKNDIF